MSWSTITTDDVLQEFTPAEQSALTRIQDNTSNLAAILARVIATTRGNIAAAGITVGDAGTVPDQLAMDVIAIARWRWLTSIPQARAMQTEERKQAYTDASRRLDDVAKGTMPVEPATAEAADDVGAPMFGTRGGSRSTDPADRNFTPESQDGI